MYLAKSGFLIKQARQSIQSTPKRSWLLRQMQMFRYEKQSNQARLPIKKVRSFFRELQWWDLYPWLFMSRPIKSTKWDNQSNDPSITIIMRGFELSMPHFLTIFFLRPCAPWLTHGGSIICRNQATLKWYYNWNFLWMTLWFIYQRKERTWHCQSWLK